MEHSFCGVAVSMTIYAQKLHNRSRDRNEDCLIVAMRVANPLLRVLSMLACTNWLAPNLGARNDLVSVFHQTLTLCEGAGGARLGV